MAIKNIGYKHLYFTGRTGVLAIKMTHLYFTSKGPQEELIALIPLEGQIRSEDITQAVVKHLKNKNILQKEQNLCEHSSGHSLNEMLGELFIPRDMPEPPKEGFFRGLFGGGARPFDREELFGEGSGRPSRLVAKQLSSNVSQIENLGQRAGTASSEVSRAHQMVMERGDKLGHLEERTERMHNQAQEFGSSAHQLMLKYKDKKWYQL